MLGEKAEDGPLFFMRINSDHSFAALCQASGLTRPGGTLLEEFSGKWDAMEKPDGLFVRLTGSFISKLFNPDPRIRQGAMMESTYFPVGKAGARGVPQ